MPRLTSSLTQSEQRNTPRIRMASASDIYVHSGYGLEQKLKRAGLTTADARALLNGQAIDIDYLSDKQYHKAMSLMPEVMAFVGATQ